MKYRSLALVIGANLLFAWSASRADEPKKVTLARVQTKAGASYIGELIKEDNASVAIRNLDSGTANEFEKEKIAKFENPITEAAAVRYVGLPKLMAWKVSQLPNTEPVVGKIAKITPSVVYLNVGEERKILPGQELTVYRNAEEIIDPDTKKVLARERQKLARLQVVEVAKDYSKAKMLGELETPLAVGDEVESAREKMLVAVLPIESGATDADALTEQLTTALANKGIPIVERALLDKVLAEEILQNTPLFDEKTAQLIGKQLGATAVLTGKIVGRGEAHVRLIHVGSGRVLSAATGQAGPIATSPAAPSIPPYSRAERLPPGTVAAFDFERRSIARRGGKLLLNDLSGKGSDGEIVDAKFVPGVHGTCINFPGKGFAKFSDKNLPKGDSARSILFWLRIDTHIPDTMPFGYGTAEDGDATYVTVFTAGRSDGKPAAKVTIGNPGGRNEPSGQTTVADGKWHHLGLVYDGKGTFQLYVDGHVELTFGRNYRTSSPGHAYIGGWVDGNNHLNGSVDDFIILDRAISADEVSMIKNTAFVSNR